MSKLSKRKVALYKHLLHNGKLSIKNAFLDFGISNIAREVRRLIEIPLDTELLRVKKVGQTKDGEPCYWFEYSATDLNKIKLKEAFDGESKPIVKNGLTKYFEDVEEWENSFYCNECGCDKHTDFYYNRTVSNGECYICKHCKTEVMVNDQPKEDDY